MHDPQPQLEQPQTGPLTLAIDIGGTRLKAGVLDTIGTMVVPVARIDTPYPAAPELVVELLTDLVRPLGAYDRVSVGFPGVVRDGVVITAPNLGTQMWRGCHLAAELSARLHRPVRLLNDADVQGLGVVVGQGLECMITLGTGMGFALFHHGMLLPHLELSQHPVRKGTNYDRYIGNAALAEIGKTRWNRRVQRALGFIETLTSYDRLHIGGGNAKVIRFELPPRVQIVSNEAGITGGVRLWEPRFDTMFAAPPVAETYQPA
jgi:polyphosphate glucokinase